jgi:hypothetical protein
MNWNKWQIIVGTVLLVVAWTSMHVLANDGDAKPTIDMPAKDRETLDHYLGRGVVGKAVPADVIGDPRDYVQLGEDATLIARVTSGDLTGQTLEHSITRVKQASGEPAWRVSIGHDDILVMAYGKGGDLVFLSHAEPRKKLDGLYSPPPPLLIKGMKPGSTHKADFAVKIVPMDNPNRVKHKGRLALELSYVGMFEVNTPSGKHKAALIRSAYKGKIGPASVDDMQYRFVVKDVGIIAMVEHKDISAFLLYNDHVKIGKLLVGPK